MKKILLLLTVTLLLQQLLPAQRTKTQSTAVKAITKEDLDASPFSKGKWEFTITKPYLDFSHQEVKLNGNSQRKQGNLDLDLGANYYVANGIGVGIEIDASFNPIKYNNGAKQHTNRWMAGANFTWGTPISSNFNFYARAGLGFGGVTDKYTPVSGNSTTDKSDLFGFKFAAGFPIQLQNDQPVFFTPEFRFRSLREKFDGGTETDNRFGFGVKLGTYLFCREMQCDSKVKHAFSLDAYDQGRSYLGVTTKGMFNFGSVKTEYNNNFPDDKDDYSNADLQVNYMYYVINDLAVGLNIDAGSSTYKNGSANKSNTSSFTFMPMLEFNIPVEPALHNLFIRGGYGFGSAKTEYTIGSITSTTKYRTTDFCAGLGYNFFFHKGLSFTPIVEYNIGTSKNKTTDNEEKYNGIEFGFGVRKFF